MKLIEFDVYKDLLREHSGLLITPDKTSMLDSRLGAVAKKWGYASVESLTLALKAMPDEQLIRDCIEAMSNHETAFFRHFPAFTFLKDIALPALSRTVRPGGKIRIMSAGCSSGQEAYSLALLLGEYAPALFESAHITAVDLSEDILARAREGLYSQYEVQCGLTIHHILKYFSPEGEAWQASAALKKIINFAQMNLQATPSSPEGFHVIFCHNVIGPMDAAFAEKVLTNLALNLAPKGFLFVNDMPDADMDSRNLSSVPGYAGIYTHA